MPQTPLQEPRPSVQLLFALSYDGGHLHGMALQPDVPTAAGLVLARVRTHLRPRRLWALSVTARLDAGVHAHINFLSLRISAPHLSWATLHDALGELEADNTDLLADLVATAVPYRLSARGLASDKTYCYALEDHWAASTPGAPQPGAHVWRIVPPLNPAAMQTAANVFVGTHDFTAFAASPKRRQQAPAQAVKRIYNMRVVVHPAPRPSSGAPRRIDIVCTAAGLLRRQMRLMVASIVCAGAGLTTPQAIARRLAGAQPAPPQTPQAPAAGLSLAAVTCCGKAASVAAALAARLHR